LFYFSKNLVKYSPTTIILLILLDSNKFKSWAAYQFPTKILSVTFFISYVNFEYLAKRCKYNDYSILIFFSKHSKQNL